MQIEQKISFLGKDNTKVTLIDLTQTGKGYSSEVADLIHAPTYQITEDGKVTLADLITVT